MSIAALTELGKELKRLAIAGTDLAKGDFRLQKLLAPIRKSGESAPVFRRVAEMLEQVASSGPDSRDAQGEASESDWRAQRFIELATLVDAVLHTQLRTGIDGTLEEMAGTSLECRTDSTFRTLLPVVEALTTSGGGRYAVICRAIEEGLFSDLRLVIPAVSGLDDSYVETSALIYRKVIPAYGEAVLPILLETLDLSGGKGHAMRLDWIACFTGAANTPLYLEALEKGSPEVRVSAVKALGSDSANKPLLHALTRDRKKEIREAALSALESLGETAAAINAKE